MCPLRDWVIKTLASSWLSDRSPRGEPCCEGTQAAPGRGHTGGAEASCPQPGEEPPWRRVEPSGEAGALPTLQLQPRSSPSQGRRAEPLPGSGPTETVR